MRNAPYSALDSKTREHAFEKCHIMTCYNSYCDILQFSKKKKTDVDTIFSSFSTLDSFVKASYRHVNPLALVKSENAASLNCE